MGCTGGLIPVGGVVGSLQLRGILLTGDADGMSEPFSWLGIATAVVSGEIAGEIVGEALTGGHSGLLDFYDSEIRQRIPRWEGAKKEKFGDFADRLEQIAEWRG